MTRISIPGKGLAAVLSGDPLRKINDNKVVFAVSGNPGISLNWYIVDREGRFLQAGDAIADGNPVDVDLRDFASDSVVLLQVACDKDILVNQLIHIRAGA